MSWVNAPFCSSIWVFPSPFTCAGGAGAFSTGSAEADNGSTIEHAVAIDRPTKTALVHRPVFTRPANHVRSFFIDHLCRQLVARTRPGRGVAESNTPLLVCSFEAK
jgi:hypothetical protein